MASKFGKSSSSFSGKNEREKFFFIAAAGATLAAVIVVVIVTSLKSGGTQVTAPEAQPAEVVAAVNTQNSYSVSLLAPETEVSAGTKLSEVRFKTLFWPKSQVPEGAFTNADELMSLWAKEKLPAGVPVQRRSTSPKEIIAQVEMLPITPGNRAVSIEVDDIAGLEGNARPGTRVDVTLTATGADGKLGTDVIVENARVLSYGGDSSSGNTLLKDRGRIMQVSRTMTLDVSPTDALKIQTARRAGSIGLLMRSKDDNEAIPVKQSSTDDFKRSDGSSVKPGNSGAGCNKGRMKIGNKEYVVGCDGSMSPVD